MQNKKRVLVLSFAMSAMLLTGGLIAQERGGLFGSFKSDASESSEGMFNLRDGNTDPQWSDGLGNQAFGQDPDEAPLGSGVLMLIAAGAGYAVVKSKKSDK